MDYILRLKVDNEFYNDYIDRFGKESVENYYKYFTKEEQIKRYTDNMIFWIERIKGTNFEKEVINYIYLKFPEYVSLLDL